MPLLAFHSLPHELQAVSIGQHPGYSTRSVMTPQHLWWWAQGKHPIIHHPGQPLQPCQILEVHVWISVPQGAAFGLSTSVLLSTALLCHIKDLPCGNAMHVNIIVHQLVIDEEQLVQGVKQEVQPVRCLECVRSCTSLSLKHWHCKVCQVFICVAPHWLVAAGETGIETPLEDNVEPENKSPTTVKSYYFPHSG